MGLDIRITEHPCDVYNTTFHPKDNKLSRNAMIDIRIRTAVQGRRLSRYLRVLLS